MNRFIIFALMAITAELLLQADEVRTADSFVLQGKVTALNTDTLTLKTSLFGALKVARTSITGLSISEPVPIQLDDKSIRIDSITSLGDGKVNICEPNGSTSIRLNQIQDIWHQWPR